MAGWACTRAGSNLVQLKSVTSATRLAVFRFRGEKVIDIIRRLSCLNDDFEKYHVEIQDTLSAWPRDYADATIENATPS